MLPGPALPLIGSKYPSLDLIIMVPKVFEPLKFDCKLVHISQTVESKVPERWTVDG